MPTISRSGSFTGLPTGKGKAGFNIDIDVQGDAQIAMHFRRISERSLNLRPAWYAIHESMLSIERKQFDSQGGHRSGGWAPLDEITITRKESMGLGTRILVATGRLMRSLTEASGKDHKFIPMKSWMLFGSNVPYVEPHMTGVESHGIPARPPIAFNETDRESWLRILRGWIVAGSPSETGATSRAGARFGATLGSGFESRDPSRLTQTLKGDWSAPTAFARKGTGLTTRPGRRKWSSEAEFKKWIDNA